MKFNSLSPKIETVAPRKKALPYSVTRIGGPEELAKWKKDQEAQEAVYQAKMITVRKRARDGAVAFVESQTGRKLTEEEKTEIEYRQSRVEPSRTPSPKLFNNPVVMDKPVSSLQKVRDYLTYRLFKIWQAANF